MNVLFFGRMRTYKRKTTRCSYTTEDLKNAAKAVNDEGRSVNAVAKEFGIKRMTLTIATVTMTIKFQRSN